MRLINILIPLLFCVSNIYTQNIFMELKSGSLNGFNTLEGKTENGTDIKIINSDPFLNNEMDKITIDLLKEFSNLSFRSINIKYINEYQTTYEFIINPFKWNSVEIDKYLTTGFTIRVGDVLKYDVDIFVDSLHLHVNGYFSNEESLLNRITHIINKPEDFLLSRNPEHIMNKFNELDAVINTLKHENELLKLENDQLSNMLVNEQREIQELKYNNLVMESRGLFGTIKNLNRDDVDWIIQTKNSNRELTAEEIKEKILDERGSKTSINIISLIFGLYFGEYDS